MEGLEYHAQPDLRRPLVVAAFKGWNDHAETGTGAVDFLRKAWDAEPFVSIDPEEFYDFTVVRPRVALDESMTRHIQWPTTEISTAPIPGYDRDVVIVSGIEPSMRWKTFCSGLMAVLRASRAEMVVTLGAFAAQVPHTRPVRVMGTTYSAELADRLGLQVPRYQGPTGVVGVLMDYCRQDAIPTASLWAWMPHYIAAGPPPKGILALIRSLEELSGIEVDTNPLEREALDFESRVESAVMSDPQAEAYVRMLERQTDEAQAQERSREREIREMPSGDELAAEFERFLREQREDP